MVRPTHPLKPVQGALLNPSREQNVADQIQYQEFKRYHLQRCQDPVEEAMNNQNRANLWARFDKKYDALMSGPFKANSRCKSHQCAPWCEFNHNQEPHMRADCHTIPQCAKRKRCEDGTNSSRSSSVRCSVGSLTASENQSCRDSGASWQSWERDEGAREESRCAE
jgi:hypothetical protein